MAVQSAGPHAAAYRGSSGGTAPSPAGALDTWHSGPACLSVELPFDTTVAGVAREEVTSLLGDEAGAIDSVTLVCSELVTNSLRHGSPPILLKVLVDPTETAPAVDITVTDGGTATHRTLEADQEHPDESGRGRLIIDALAAASSLEVGETHTRAWCRLCLTAPPSLSALPTPHASKESPHGS
ncbi:ATP-binding protein [Streptomyces sp900129855]|uniref:ATP-binding protein n=1 Tax=Streptomyces sp. 900129855 TaxID=3155129 RepID=A0ABV2ZLH7_9ACTN